MTARFLKTITFLGNDVLIPINKIENILISYNDGWRIKIKGEGDYSWEECFGDDEAKCYTRYEMIKEIIGAK